MWGSSSRGTTPTEPPLQHAAKHTVLCLMGPCRCIAPFRGLQVVRSGRACLGAGSPRIPPPSCADRPSRACKADPKQSRKAKGMVRPSWGRGGGCRGKGSGWRCRCYGGHMPASARYFRDKGCTSPTGALPALLASTLGWRGCRGGGGKEGSGGGQRVSMGKRTLISASTRTAAGAVSAITAEGLAGVRGAPYPPQSGW